MLISSSDFAQKHLIIHDYSLDVSDFKDKIFIVLLFVLLLQSI